MYCGLNATVPSQTRESILLELQASLESQVRVPQFFIADLRILNSTSFISSSTKVSCDCGCSSGIGRARPRHHIHIWSCRGSNTHARTIQSSRQGHCWRGEFCGSYGSDLVDVLYGSGKDGQ